MSVNVGTSTDNYANYSTQATVYSNTKAAETEKKESASKTTEEVGATYEKTDDTQKKASYSINKMSSEDRAALVEKLKQDMESRQAQLSELVNQMLSKQAGVSNLADLFKGDNLKKFTEADIAQAKEDVSEDGYWGVKQTSQRLFDFASALAGDDVEKMKEMQAAMEKGFKMATKSWGEELPGICHDTIKAANQLFEDYYASKGVVEG